MSFLDVAVRRKADGSLSTTIYRKKTFIGVYWNSLTSKSYKLGLINCLLDKAWKICSDLDIFHIEVLNHKKILNKNEYPMNFVDSVIFKFINKKMLLSSQATNVTVELDLQTKLFLVLPYFNDKVTKFGRQLTKLVSDAYPDVNLHVMFKDAREIVSFQGFNP